MHDHDLVRSFGWSRIQLSVLAFLHYTADSSAESACVDRCSAANCLCLQSATTQLRLSQECNHQGRSCSCCEPIPEQALDSVLQESCICTLHVHCSKGIPSDVRYAHQVLSPICAKCRGSIDGTPSGLVYCCQV